MPGIKLLQVTKRTPQNHSELYLKYVKSSKSRIWTSAQSSFKTMRRNFIFLPMATSAKKVTPLWLNNWRHLLLNILGMTRIHTYLEDTAILLPRYIEFA